MVEIMRRPVSQGSAEIVGGSPEQFGEFIRAEGAKWADVVKRAGVKVE